MRAALRAAAAAAMISSTVLSAAALRQQPAAGRAASDKILSAEVASFLEAWLIRRDPQGAVRARSSTVFSDERFLPAGLFDPAAYRRRFPTPRAAQPSRMSEAQFESRLGDFVESLTDRSEPAPKAPAGGLSERLEPFSIQIARDADPQLAARLAPLKTRTLAVAGVPSLAYAVREWKDIAWTASATIGYRAALREEIDRNKIDMQAVVCRLKQESPADPLSIVVTLWSDEATKGTSWKLVGVEVPATR
ncbi:MAG TPA: hypothetical protein VH740_18985 [Vicinamibacterales bacterium]